VMQGEHMDSTCSMNTDAAGAGPRPLALLRARGHAVVPQAGAATLTGAQQHALTVALKALQFVRPA
jgi:hypothetical protein